MSPAAFVRLKAPKSMTHLTITVACHQEQPGELTVCTTMAHNRNRIGWQNLGVSDKETASCHHKKPAWGAMA